MIYKISQTEIKEQKLIHPWFIIDTFSNLQVTTQVHLLHFMLLLLAILIFWYFEIFFNRPRFSQKMFYHIEFPSCTHAFFSLYFFLCQRLKVISVTKSLLKINEPLKPINSRIRNSWSNQMLTFKNWSVYFSYVLGYIRFQQSHDNKCND